MGGTAKSRSRRGRRRGRPAWALPAIVVGAVVAVAGLVWLSNHP